MLPNLTEAEQFVKCLAGEGPTTFVRLRKNIGIQKTYFETWGKVKDRLQIANELGSDIYITANQMHSQSRIANNVASLRTLYADYDQGKPTTWALEPSLLIESSPGKYQAYWLLAEPISTQIATGVVAWHAVQRALVYATGADRAAIDSSRILRLPGFINYKYDGKPLVKLLSTSNIRYSLDQIINAFRLTLEPPPSPVAKKSLDTLSLSLQSEDLRARRYDRWLAAASTPPSPGLGKRNKWFFDKACYGVCDLALPLETVAERLSSIALMTYNDDSYNYDKCYQIAVNADKVATGGKGSAALALKIVLE